MPHTPHRHAVLTVALLALFVGLTSLTLAAGALRHGAVPSFEARLLLTPRAGLIIRNGPRCRADLPSLACQGGIVTRDLRVSYLSRRGLTPLLTIPWDEG